MVMEASGSRERKYCHCRGGGQRLMRTSRRLMERSTDRLTTTGTNSEPPCCVGEAGRRHWCLHTATVTYLRGSQSQYLCEMARKDPRDFPCQMPGQNSVMSCSPLLAISGDRKSTTSSSPAALTGSRFSHQGVDRRDLRPPSQQALLASAAHHSQWHPHLKAQLCSEWVVISHGVHGLVQS